jgi:hypothetical protein
MRSNHSPECNRLCAMQSDALARDPSVPPCTHIGPSQCRRRSAIRVPDRLLSPHAAEASPAVPDLACPSRQMSTMPATPESSRILQRLPRWTTLAEPAMNPGSARATELPVRQPRENRRSSSQISAHPPTQQKRSPFARNASCRAGSGGGPYLRAARVEEGEGTEQLTKGASNP